MRKLIMGLVIVVVAIGVGMAPAPANAVDFSAFGAYTKLSATGAGESWGIGARVGAFDFFDHMQIALTATYNDTWTIKGYGGGLTDAVYGDIESHPFDLGILWYFNADGNDGFYAGGGLTYYFLKTKAGGKFDDTAGFYLNAGYQFTNMGLFLEGVYRNGDADVTELEFPDDLTTSFGVDVGSFGLVAGWRF